MKLWISAALLVTLTGCGGGDSEASAMSAANALKGDVPTVTKVVKITEDNDPNGDLGRPGKYEQAASIYDSRAKCDSDLDVTCGAKIEVWANEDDAKARADFIQDALKGAQILGSEYDYIKGRMLLRVSGNLKPSEAKEYKTAFLG
jgi:hypothetical protein